MTSVKVAVRVRPFNAREVTMKAHLMLRVEGNSVWIKNPVSFNYLSKYECIRKMEKKKCLVLIMSIGHMMALLRRTMQVRL